MAGTYASAALVCAASLLVGRALLALAGRPGWSWMEPAVGFGAIVSVAGVLARAPGHATSATLGVALLILAALIVVWGRPARGPATLAIGVTTAVAVVAVLSIPFAVSGRWGLLGIGFNNDLGLHLAWAEWLRSGFGPAPDSGYPLGPHALADAVAALPGIGLGQAFLGTILAIGALTGLTALGPLSSLPPGRRVLGAVLVAVPYLAASYFAQAAFKETAEALFVLGLAVGLADLSHRLAARGTEQGEIGPAAWERVGAALPWLAGAGGIVFSYSFAGLAWPIAIVALWGLTQAGVRRALRPRALLRVLLRPSTLLVLLVGAGLAALLTIGPLGFGGGFRKVAGSNTYGPVSPVEAFAVWWTPNYRLDAVGGAHLTGLAGAIGALAVAAGLLWWVRRRELAIPAAFAACVALYLLSLPLSGEYSQAKALMIAAPLTMLVAVRPLLSEFWRRRADSVQIEDGIGPSAAGPDREVGPGGVGLARWGWTGLAVVFIAGAAYSSFLALRDAPVGPPGHGGELRAFLPILRGQPVLYAGQDRYAAYELLGADTHVPLVEFPDTAVSQNPEKPFDTGNAYSPIDFDSFSRGTLNRFRYVVTGRAAWNSAAPPNFKRIAATPSYVLWERTGPVPEMRHVLLEGTEAGAFADCTAPEVRILLGNRGRATLFPDAVIGGKADWDRGSVLGTGESTAQVLRLAAGTWDLSLQYFAPFGLTLSAPGFTQPLAAALDGQRPNTISLGNNGQFWPAGRLRSAGGPLRFTVSAAAPSLLQRLTGYDGKAYVGELVAVPNGPRHTVPLGAACDSWIDSYESKMAP